MASSEGQTELLSGWSCVVHQPSEDPEPSELPSTVDITAFSAGLNVEPAGSTNATNRPTSDTDSDSESGSHGSGSGSGSCSASDSSDSDSSSSSTSSRSRSPSPEFSVTSQSPGLRMTIATVRKLGAELPSPSGECSKDAHVKDKDKEKRASCSSSGSCDISDSDSSASTLKSSKVTANMKTAPKVEPKTPAVAAPVSATIAAPPPARTTRARRAPPPAERKERERRAVARKEKDVSPRVLRERARLKRKKVSVITNYLAYKRRGRTKRTKRPNSGDECFYLIHITIMLFFIAVCYALTYFT